MNGNKDSQFDDYRSLQVLDEISKNGQITQRTLSKNLGVALGLVNSYIKNLISKGYITVSGIPAKRYTYYLTAKGFSEKTRLTYEHLKNFTNLYRVARNDFSVLFQGLKENGKWAKIAFYGKDEVAEIAYLSLKEAGLELAAIADKDKKGEEFFGYSVVSAGELKEIKPDIVVITSAGSIEELKKQLLDAGIDNGRILDISSGGWINKISKDGTKNERQ